MKKLFSFLIASAMCLSLAACGGNATTPENNSTQEVTPPDLTGEWRQTNSNSEDSWQSAIITEDTITVYWVSDNGDTQSLYWAGTYEAPQDAEEPYSWDSVNDTEQTANAILASNDETKTFTYENGEISYQASALGTTTTIRLEKQ